MMKHDSTPAADPESSPGTPGGPAITLALPRGAPDYPARLLQLRRPPEVLYVRGTPALLNTPQIAMVGARAASPAGKAIAFEFASALGRAGIAVTSGLATGIDTAAHAGALAGGGTTLALCAHGLDQIYPARNTALARRIQAGGALAGVHPDGEPPRRQFFPGRNALISALSLAVLVVEARPDSGSLITARHARDQGRPLFAIPGAIRDPQAAGCNLLIRNGARAVTSPVELLSDLGFNDKIQILESTPANPFAGMPGRPPLDKPLEMLLDAAGFEPVSIDFLSRRTGLSAAAVASMLLLLELHGRIAPQPGGRYRRLK